MTEFEILEMAAKAVGYTTHSHGNNGIHITSEDGDFCWNPLTNKGDCLQMEIDLKLFAYPAYNGWSVGVLFYGTFHVKATHADRQRASTIAAANIAKEQGNG